ncbi:cysteine protease atg4 [Metarhizium album ARSEF 1941]|uniref:Cysteine protease n=1 Tax=Metarhizium album (strain ARSEF 1941) TaxID=1081103 RepID=A0A0B2X5S2_METAS|nr:cysteine protease atg4 [Metarhizium album ARSEF 1941]KHO01118.1 cysteine protease atg4 [Metarhizium album ARSEF 1941]
MESAIANVDLGKYRRIVQLFWDPEPVNDQQLDQPVWCLGRVYSLSRKDKQDVPTNARHEDHSAHSLTKRCDISSKSKEEIPVDPLVAMDTVELPLHSNSGSFSSSLAYEEPSPGGTGWPAAFLDDFAARFWMTYRSNFELIPKSTDPKAASALSLSVRIKSQIVDQNGFTSDSGWGCMIRSGQSLLANAMAFLDLGRDWRRGMLPHREQGLLALFADDPRAPYSIHNFRSGKLTHGGVTDLFHGRWA